MGSAVNHIEYSLHPDVSAMTVGRDSALPFPVLQMHQVHDVHVAVIDNPDITLPYGSHTCTADQMRA